MNIYECIAVFRDDTTEEIINKSLDKISKVVKVTEIEKWGIRQLVYPIGKSKKAYYVLIYIIDVSEEKILNQFKKDKDIIKYICVKKENTNENNNTFTMPKQKEQPRVCNKPKNA